MAAPRKEAAPRAEAGGILAVWTDVAPELEADFNEWYWREHLPERLAVPGFLSGRRYRAIAGAPRYFAWYELDSVKTLASPAYLDRLDNPTEWTERVMPGFRNTTRAVFRAASVLGRMSGALMLTLRAGPDAKKAPGSALLADLAAQPGIFRVQLWQEAAVRARATREAALRGGADQRAPWALTVEAAAAEDLDAADARLRDAAAGPAAVARYRLLCSLCAPS